MLLINLSSLPKPTIFHKLIVSSVFLLASFLGNSQIIISEYLEGASNNKCIEIYNTGSSSVNLSSYSLKIFANGSSSANNTIPLSGTLASCETYVVCHSSAITALKNVANLETGSLGFNGDDAIGLFNGASMVDLFGKIGNDPGSQWTGVSPGTKDGRFIRKPDYCTGVTTNPTGTGSGAFATFTTTNWESVSSLTDPTGFGSHTSNCSSCSTPPSVSVSVGALSTTPFNVTCTAGSNGTLAFTSTGTFNSGNTFTAQLSDASGSFGTPTGIGTFSGTSTGTDPSGTINIAIPQATSSGTNYKIRIVSSNPAGVSDTTANFSITLTGGPCTLEPPHLTSVIINACTGSGSCQEGNNEIVFGNTGGYSVNVTASNFNFHYGSNSTASSNTNYTDVLVQNTTTTSAVNTAAGCAGTYVEGTGATIPPNSAFILASTTLCTDAFTWSGLCGQGPIYIIYQNDVNWNANGNFVNSTTSPTDPNRMRYFHTSITTTSGQTFPIDYSFDRSQNTNADGAFVTYTSAGGAPASYDTCGGDCALNPIVLPIEVTEFSGEYRGVGTVLKWTSATEINSDYYLLEKSVNGFDFELLANIPAAGNSTSPIDYHYFDRDVFNGVYYYRLIGFDYDGTKTNHGIVAVHVKSSKIIFNQEKQIINIGDGKGISVYALDGKLIVNAENESRISFTKKGFYVVLNQETGETLRIINP